MSIKQNKPCPPEDAVCEDRYPVYRFIEGEEIHEIDFMNHIERGLPFSKDSICAARALSFFDNEKSVEEKQNNHKRFRNMKVVAGHITKESGVHKIKRGHINHWVYENVDMLKVFLGEVKV